MGALATQENENDKRGMQSAWNISLIIRTHFAVENSFCLELPPLNPEFITHVISFWFGMIYNTREKYFFIGAFFRVNTLAT